MIIIIITRSIIVATSKLTDIATGRFEVVVIKSKKQRNENL